MITIGKEAIYELQDTVAAYLRHADPELRGAAIRVLAFYWRLEAYRPVAERMALDDEDDEARAIALMAWTSYSHGSKDQVVLARLNSLLRDTQQPYSVRSQAYRSLLRVAGLPGDAWPKHVAALDDLDAEIDWDLVARLVS